jgi:hypothetical protein
MIVYWLIAANSNPTSWECGEVRGLQRCSKILELTHNLIRSECHSFQLAELGMLQVQTGGRSG